MLNRRFPSASPVLLAVLAGGLALMSHAAPPDTIRIGGFHTLSGAITAPEALWGAEIAVATINARGGVNGIKLELLVKDHQCAADKMRPVQQAALASGMVAVIVSCSGPAAASAPLATQSKVPLFNIGGQDPSIRNLSPYLLSAVVLSDVSINVALDYIRNDLKASKVAIVYTNNPIGNGLNKALAAAAPRAAATIVGAFSVDATQQDMGAVVSRLAQSNPDVVYLATNGQATAQMIKQAREQGHKFPFVSYVGLYGELSKIAGSAMNGLVWTSAAIESDTPTYKAYEQAFKAAHATSQSSYIDITAHDSVGIIAQALQLSAKKGGDWWTGERIRDQIIETATFTGLVAGTYSFLPDGTVLRPLQLYRQQPAGPELVKTYSLDMLQRLK